MSKYVENYWAEELPNGVIHLLINLKQKGCFYHRYNDTEYLIAATEEEYEEGQSDCILRIKDFVPEDNGVIYVKASNLEKDQLSFYFIPYEKDWIKGRGKRIILKETSP